MAEARKCDRCHEFYDISKEQQDRRAPYEIKGDFVNLRLWMGRNNSEVESRWYDLCPKCMTFLENWLANPDDWKPEDCLTTVDNEYNKAIAAIKTYKDEDPCNGCPNPHCEQCEYGYKSEEERKELYKKNNPAKLSDPYEEGGL